MIIVTKKNDKARLCVCVCVRAYLLVSVSVSYHFQQNNLQPCMVANLSWLGTHDFPCPRLRLSSRNRLGCPVLRQTAYYPHPGWTSSLV